MRASRWWWERSGSDTVGPGKEGRYGRLPGFRLRVVPLVPSSRHLPGWRAEAGACRHSSSKSPSGTKPRTKSSKVGASQVMA